MYRTLDSGEQVLRIQATLKIALILTGAISVFWAGYFISQDNWRVLPVSALSISAVIAATWLFYTARIRLANVFIFGSMCTIVFLYCAFLDLTTGETPRSTHNYFLVLAMFAWMVFKFENPWIRYTTTLVALSLFTFFASNSWGMPTAFALDQSERVVSTWVHNFTAMSLFLTLLWLAQRKFNTPTDAAEAELKAAIFADQLMLFYQPQVGNDGKVVGAEALIRWRHPTKGIVSPGEFMPLAERSGLILEIGQWVLDTACIQLENWSKHPCTSHLKISINVSALQFKQSDYVEKVMKSLQRSHANASLLTLELTESMLVNDVNDLIKKMDALRAMGVRLSLDDFGTGYSSLSYLKKLPLDQLKIDQSFIRDMLTDASDMAIVRTVIELARSLNLHVIAEGVETDEQRQYLASVGCFSFQGFLISKPVSIADFNSACVDKSQHTVGKHDFVFDPQHN